MIITLLSDFGDVYPASMKGVILSINPEVNLVDISHSVPHYNIRAGAFILMTYAQYFPSGTVHIAVVDPGVGTERLSLAIKAESFDYGIHYFIGPDNGLLIPAARSIGDFEVYEIADETLFLSSVSFTFHGRDIFAPVGAHISRGLNISKVGRQVFDFIDLDFAKGRRTEGCLQGNIIFIDSFGNIVTNISSDIVDFQPGDALEIQGRRILFHSSYGFCKKDELVALIGSHGYLEIAINQGNAALLFNKKIGDEFCITNSSPV